VTTPCLTNPSFFETRKLWEPQAGRPETVPLE
jgi:hypothetical protein